MPYRLAYIFSGGFDNFNANQDTLVPAAPLGWYFSFFSPLLSTFLKSKTYFSKVERSTQKSRGTHLSRPRWPFWGPVAADMEKGVDARTMSADIFKNCGTFWIVEEYLILFWNKAL